MDYCNSINSIRNICSDKMIKIEDILFWILIITIVGIAIWLLFGSPTLETALISLTLFVAGSELLIWRKIFSVDKNTAVGFAKVKGDLKIVKYDLGIIKNELKDIKNLIKRI